MDDTPDKLRRNLIFVSALTLAAWWLRAEPSGTLSILGTTLASHDRDRLWTAAGVAILYCGMRYHFSEGRRKQYQDSKAEYLRQIQKDVKNWIADQELAKRNRIARKSGSEVTFERSEIWIKLSENAT
ncbi:hypothetical protein [Pigmentiphaga sp. CHJ604]|uniref:hypothetical protein n=1 Tax=Pigmentiphaga sp. CHJ604 TaxID=3081984 RepID=UPI0030D02697